LLTGLTNTVLETALDAELSEHLGYDKHDPIGGNGGNSGNGTRTKTVLTEIGPVEIEVQRDRAGSFEPVIVRKHQHRLDGIDAIVVTVGPRPDHRAIAAHVRVGEVVHHIAAQILPHRLGVPRRPRQQVLHPVRSGVTGLIRDRPTVRARQPGQQTEQERASPPARLDPAEPRPDQAHQLIEARPPAVGSTLCSVATARSF
jgi:hypothetical protein